MFNMIVDYVLIRRSGLFDRNFYLTKNPDVKSAKVDPLFHFIRHGWREKRNPCNDFDIEYYLSTYPDIRSAGMNPVRHYILHGFYEGRQINNQNTTKVPKSGRTWFFIKKFTRLAIKLNRRQIKALVILIYKTWKNYGFSFLIEKFKIRINNILTPDINSANNNLSTAFYSGIDFLEFDYKQWIAENECTNEELLKQKELGQLFDYRPKISILTPLFNTPTNLLKMTVESIMNQTYTNWELCLVDGNSSNAEIRPFLERMMKLDSRIKCEFLNENRGIAGNTNAALKLASGEFVHLMDHDDELPPNALFEVVDHLNHFPETDLIYSDEDKISMDGKRHTPFFKPGWSPDMLQAGMYIGHSTYRTHLVLEIGGFRPAYDFSQDYDLALRFTEKTTKISHIPKVLYHWRTAPGSAAGGGKEFARQTNIGAVEDAIVRRGFKGEAIILPACNRLFFEVIDSPLVSIIIPSDNYQSIVKSVQNLVHKTLYKNFEIVIVTNKKIIPKLKTRSGFEKVLFYQFDEEYNFSKKCNLGVEISTGEYVLFLNDDVYPIDEDWLNVLLGYFQQDSIGAISPKLLYTNGTIQHAGLITGVRNLFGTAFHTWPADSRFYFNLPQMTRTVSALSAACLLMKKSVFNEIGGFDPINTPISHSDFDLCFKIRELDLRLVYTPHTSLEHVGHQSIKELDTSGVEHSQKANTYMLKRWGKYIENDPYFPTNMRDELYFDSLHKIRMHLDKKINISKKTDILVHTHDLSRSGAPLFAFDLASFLNAGDKYVLTLSGDGGSLSSDYQEKELSLIIDQYGVNHPESITTLIHDFDLVIVNTILGWELVLQAKKIGKPVVWIIHEGEFGTSLADSNLRIQDAMKIADVVLFPSQNAKNIYQKYNANNNFSSFIFGCYPFSINVPDKNVEIHKSNTIKFVHVGSVEKRKGQDILISAYERLTSAQRDKVEITFVGRELVANYYSEQLKRTKKHHNIHWMGNQSHTEVLKLISECDILVNSARDETGPLVIYEAMSAGKPVIGSKTGAVSEIIEENFNGFIFNVEDVDHLAGIMSKIISAPEQLEELGRNALETYKEKLNRENTIQKFENIIQDLLK